MFKITLSPQAADKDTTIIADGDTLIIDGVPVDFSELAEGDECDTLPPLIGVARRSGGDIHVGVLLQYNSFTAEPVQSSDPADYMIDLVDGQAVGVIKQKEVAQDADIIIEA